MEAGFLLWCVEERGGEIASDSYVSDRQIDGPYGGVHSSLSRHDKVLLVGGDAGITFLIPQIFSLLEKPGHVCFVNLVWAVPSIGQSVISQAIAFH